MARSRRRRPKTPAKSPRPRGRGRARNKSYQKISARRARNLAKIREGARRARAISVGVRKYVAKVRAVQTERGVSWREAQAVVRAASARWVKVWRSDSDEGIADPFSLFDAAAGHLTQAQRDQCTGTRYRAEVRFRTVVGEIADDTRGYVEFADEYEEEEPGDREALRELEGWAWHEFFSDGPGAEKAATGYYAMLRSLRDEYEDYLGVDYQEVGGHKIEVRALEVWR